MQSPSAQSVSQQILCVFFSHDGSMDRDYCIVADERSNGALRSTDHLIGASCTTVRPLVAGWKMIFN